MSCLRFFHQILLYPFVLARSCWTHQCLRTVLWRTLWFDWNGKRNSVSNLFFSLTLLKIVAACKDVSNVGRCSDGIVALTHFSLRFSGPFRLVKWTIEILLLANATRTVLSNLFPFGQIDKKCLSVGYGSCDKQIDSDESCLKIHQTRLSRCLQRIILSSIRTDAKVGRTE